MGYTPNRTTSMPFEKTFSKDYYLVASKKETFLVESNKSPNCMASVRYHLTVLTPIYVMCCFLFYCTLNTFIALCIARPSVSLCVPVKRANTFNTGFLLC